ncbi:MAG: HupE/UreJ family protein [Nostocaceae cyanobacterium]|nr:HupE/UreJ family protein [Nostocaceae cyanobacterium]
MKKLVLNGLASSGFLLQATKSKILQAGLAMAFMLSFIAKPAYAHHPFGGGTPTNLFEGFMSGLGHPIIGIDHFTFVVAVGLLAALKPRGGIFVPIAFIIATLAGTGIHLQSLDLPAPEIVISASVLGFGIMLAMKDSPNLGWLIGTAAIAGIFHGYAYGEAIVGAQMTPLVAYLAGFAIIQLIVSLIAFQVGKLTLRRIADQPSLMLRFAGFTIAGVGAAFLSSALLA